MKNKVLIIAEAGVNHNGELEKALLLVEKAAESGADYVKFQTFKADRIVSKKARMADYQVKNLNDKESQFSMLQKLEIPIEWYEKLIDHANNLGIKFLSTGFDEDSIDFLESLEPNLYKIPSGELTNKPYLQHIANKKRPIILSSGMASLSEIEEAIDVILETGFSKKDITVLHCNTEYPTPMKDVNLKAMNHIHSTLGVEVGYSDHTLGIEVPIAAVALGAKVIEKHFTLDRTLSGPDHLASLEPEELKEMVMAIRNIEQAISGSALKEPSESEIPNREVARKSIHVIKDLSIGDILEKKDLIMLRPGDGISPMEIDNVLNKRLAKNLEAFSKLKWEDLKN